MATLGGVDPALAAALLIALNGVVPLPRAAVCIPAGAALGLAAVGPIMLGTAIGFALAFLLARFALRAAVERVAARRPRLAAAMRTIDAEGWRLLAVLRLGSPVPGPVINAACGVTGMSLATFLATSVVAVLPQTLLFVDLGMAGRTVVTSGSLANPNSLLAIAGVIVAGVAVWRVGTAAKRQEADDGVEPRGRRDILSPLTRARGP